MGPKRRTKTLAYVLCAIFVLFLYLQLFRDTTNRMRIYQKEKNIFVKVGNFFLSGHTSDVTVNFTRSRTTLPSTTANNITPESDDHYTTTRAIVNNTYTCGRYNSYKYSMNSILDEAVARGETYNFTQTENESIVDVFIIPTSHNDPGWIKTFEDYYNGKTKHILNNLVKYLTLYPKMTMIWPEVVFLEKWWQNASEPQRISFKRLIVRGQLEIVSGGWVSPDEATCHYSAVLDQLIQGHQWLKKTLDVKPKACWPLDQFGYSMTLPYIWSKAGMKNLGILRVTNNVKTYLSNRKMLDFIWRQQWDSSGSSDVFCHIEPFLWFVTDTGCGPDTHVCSRLVYRKGNPNLNPRELAELADELVEQLKMKASLYKKRVILIPIGNDFVYDTEQEWKSQFSKISNLTEYINKNQKRLGVRVQFGTVTDYFEKLSKQGSEYPVIKGDFFTYAEGGTEYWSGYFSTRPFDKRIGRVLLELVHAAELSTTFVMLDSMQYHYIVRNLSGTVRLLQNAHKQLGLFQHHDAITGTSTHETATDYRMRLFVAIKDAQKVIATNFKHLLQDDDSVNVVPLTLQKRYDLPMENIVVNITAKQTNILIWNPFTSDRNEIVCVVVNNYRIKVMSNNNTEVSMQINPIWKTLNGTYNKRYELCFEINVWAGSGALYKIITVDRQNINNMARIGSRRSGKMNQIWRSIDITKPLAFLNKYIYVSFSSHGMLENLCRLNPSSFNVCTSVDFDWIIYQRISGDAYVYTAERVPLSLIPNIWDVRVVHGKIITKVTLVHKLFEQTIIIYNTTSVQGQYLHFENEVFLLSDENNGHELLLNLQTDFQNNDSSYFTDANGLQMVKRFYRPKMSSGANMYPMTTMVFMQDDHKRITLHSAQPLGVGSFKIGSIEVLMDRRPALSGKGLTESVLDNRPAKSRFFLQLEDVETQDIKKSKMYDYKFPSSYSSLINDLLQHPLQLFLVRGKIKSDKELKFLRQELPPGIVFANFRTFFNDHYSWNGTGVTLHRKWIPCDGDGKSYYTDRLTLQDLFNYEKPMHISKSQLTYLNSEGDITDNSPIHLKPMDLESFYMSWG